MQSINSNLGFGHVSALLLWNVKEVEDTVVSHDSQSPVLLVKRYNLSLLVDFNLSEAAFRVEEVRH